MVLFVLSLIKWSIGHFPAILVHLLDSGGVFFLIVFAQSSLFSLDLCELGGIVIVKSEKMSYRGEGMEVIGVSLDLQFERHDFLLFSFAVFAHSFESGG